MGGMARKAMHLARKEAPAARAGAQARSQRAARNRGRQPGSIAINSPTSVGEFGGFDRGRNFAPSRLKCLNSLYRPALPSEACGKSIVPPLCSRPVGASPSGKAVDFDSTIRRFESSRPSQAVRLSNMSSSEDGKGPQTAGFPYLAIVSMLPFCRLGRPNAAQRVGPKWPERIAKLNDALRIGNECRLSKPTKRQSIQKRSARQFERWQRAVRQLSTVYLFRKVANEQVAIEVEGGQVMMTRWKPSCARSNTMPLNKDASAARSLYQLRKQALADSTFIFAHDGPRLKTSGKPQRLRQPTALTFDHHSGRDPPFESARREE